MIRGACLSPRNRTPNPAAWARIETTKEADPPRGEKGGRENSVIIGAGFMMGLAPHAPALPVQDRRLDRGPLETPRVQENSDARDAILRPTSGAASVSKNRGLRRGSCLPGYTAGGGGKHTFTPKLAGTL